MRQTTLTQSKFAIPKQVADQVSYSTFFTSYSEQYIQVGATVLKYGLHEIRSTRDIKIQESFSIAKVNKF